MPAQPGSFVTNILERGREVRDSASSMRESIIDVAQGIFSKFGYKKTTMDEIAQEVHKEKSSIYHYFKGKEEIFLEVVNKEIRIIQEELRRNINQQESPQSRLRAFIVTRIQCLKRLPNLYSLLRDDNLMHVASFREVRDTYRESELQLVTQILSFGIVRGVFRGKTNLDIVIKGVMTAFSGIESLWSPEKEDSEFEQDVDNVMELVFHGIVERQEAALVLTQVSARA